MAILIKNNQDRHKLSPEKILQAAQTILNELGSPDAELSIVIVDDTEIAELNQTYLHRKGPTNVIAFPMREGDYTDITPQLLGDVVISADTAEKEGQQSGIPMEERFTQLLVHGILHLFGYDHEHDEDQALEMEVKSNELLAILLPQV